MLPIRILSCGVATLWAAHAFAFDHSHAALDRVLKASVREGSVDYPALKANPAPLTAYLDQLAEVPEGEFKSWPEPDRLAFLINLYNAATLKLIVDEYPLKSIRRIGWLPGAAWKRPFVRAFGRVLTLDEIEHGIIRQEYRDARVHFALVCAARGCPPLRSEPFVSARLDAQLEEQGRIFLGQTNKNHVDGAARTIHLSPIFKWFAQDFEAQAGSVLKFVAPFFPPETQRTLAQGEWRIAYTDYDWSLNERAAAAK